MSAKVWSLPESSINKLYYCMPSKAILLAKTPLDVPYEETKRYYYLGHGCRLDCT